VKTDRIDTERLLRSLMAYLRGEPKVWSVVRVPSIAEEDARAAAPRAGSFWSRKRVQHRQTASRGLLRAWGGEEQSSSLTRDRSTPGRELGVWGGSYLASGGQERGMTM